MSTSYTARSLEHIPSLSARGLMGRYIADADFARRLYGRHFASDDDLASLAEALSAREYPRERLCEALRRMNSRWGAGEQTKRNIAGLESGALVVLTGQQTGLFGGPLYTVYKALTAVAWARDLSERLGRQVVPVFWLAGDDHDLDEINHILLPGPGAEPMTFRYECSSLPGARVSRQRLDEDFPRWTERVFAALPEGPGRERVLADCQACYRPAASWQDACAELLTRWLGRFGLILVTPDDADLKSIMSPVFRAELLEPEASLRSLADRERAIVAEGYRPQVVRPEGASLLFVDDEAGVRRRLDFAETGYVAQGRKAPAERSVLAMMLRTHPALFSANALLRPVTGDVVFPTIAHVMGPGETAYMAQSRGLYERHGIPMPIVVPRARLSVIEPEAAAAAERVGLPIDDAFASADRMVSLLAERRMAEGCADGVTDARRELTAIYERLSALAAEYTPGMKTAVSSALVKSHKLLGRVEGKLEQGHRANVRREHGEDIARLAGMLCPKGTPQERVYPALPYLIRHGERWLDAVLESISTRSADHVGVFPSN